MTKSMKWLPMCNRLTNLLSEIGIYVFVNLNILLLCCIRNDILLVPLVNKRYYYFYQAG